MQYYVLITNRLSDPLTTSHTCLPLSFHGSGKKEAQIIPNYTLVLDECLQMKLSVVNQKNVADTHTER